MCKAYICLQTEAFDKLLLYCFIVQRLCVCCAKFTYILVLLALEIGPEQTKLSSLFPFTGHSTSYEYRYHFVQCFDSTDTVSDSPLLGGSVIYS